MRLQHFKDIQVAKDESGRSHSFVSLATQLPFADVNRTLNQPQLDVSAMANSELFQIKKWSTTREKEDKGVL